MFSYFFGKRAPKNENFQPLLSQQDAYLIEVKESNREEQNETHYDIPWLNNDCLSIVFSYFGEFSDFEKIALFSYQAVYNYLDKDSHLANILLNVTKLDLPISEISNVIDNINEEAKKKLLDLQSIEKNPLIKKSTGVCIASFIPGAILIPIGNNKINVASHFQDLSDLAYNSFMDSCNPYARSFAYPNCDSDIVANCETLHDKYNCNPMPCYDYCSYLNLTNNTPGVLMLIFGVLSMIGLPLIAWKLRQSKLLDETSLNQVLNMPAKKLISSDLQTQISQILDVSEEDVSRLSIYKILTQLKEMLDIKQKAKNKWLEQQNIETIIPYETPLRQLKSKLFPPEQPKESVINSGGDSEEDKFVPSVPVLIRP